jgi:hypothetical protein
MGRHDQRDPNGATTMTLTHLSHLDLTEIARTGDSIVFEGTLAACKRMAFAHGMEIERYEGPILSMNGGVAQYGMASETRPAAIWFKNGGLIIKGRDNYCFVMPLGVWMND